MYFFSYFFLVHFVPSSEDVSSLQVNGVQAWVFSAMEGLPAVGRHNPGHASWACRAWRARSGGEPARIYPVAANVCPAAHRQCSGWREKQLQAARNGTLAVWGERVSRTAKAFLQFLQTQWGVGGCLPVPLPQGPGGRRELPIPAAIHLPAMRGHWGPGTHQAALPAGGRCVLLCVRQGAALRCSFKSS